MPADVTSAESLSTFHQRLKASNPSLFEVIYYLLHGANLLQTIDSIVDLAVVFIIVKIEID